MTVNQIETVIECLTQAIDGLGTVNENVLGPIDRALVILRSERKAMKGDDEARKAAWSENWKK